MAEKQKIAQCTEQNTKK